MRTKKQSKKIKRIRNILFIHGIADDFAEKYDENGRSGGHRKRTDGTVVDDRVGDRAAIERNAYADVGNKRNDRTIERNDRDAGNYFRRHGRLIQEKRLIKYPFVSIHI